MKIDESTGEILPENTMPLTDKAPAIILDVSEVAKYHTEPMKLVEKINAQAGYVVFDITTKKGRDACRAHAAQIIKCIAPACKESNRLADEAKKVVTQSLNFRKLFDAGVREIAEYHRKPLTEWEQEQERIAEQERIFAEKMEAMRLYQLDWDDAIAFDELFTLRKEKAARDAEAEALKQLQEQDEYERQLQERAIIKERERHEQEIEQLKRDQEAERIKQGYDIKNLTVKEANKLIKSNQEITEPVTISKTEYFILKSDSDRLHKIIELWQQANRMTESANRADSSSVRNAELKEAQKVRNEAVKMLD